MKKQLLALLLSFQLAVPLTGCGGALPKEEMVQKGQSSEDDNGNNVEEIRVQDDYYEYINQYILSNIQLNATDAHWDWFSELDAAINEEMEELIRDLSEDDTVYERGSSEQKIKDLYECVSNTQNRVEVGLGPLKPYLDGIRNAKDIGEYVDALARFSGDLGFSSIVGGYSVMQDKEDSSQYAVYLLYADPLIGKEYVEGENTQEYVEMYMDYVKDMLCTYGMEEAQAEQSADSIEVLLRDICSATLTTEQYYDPSMTYNVYTKEMLQQLYTNVDVDRMLKTLRIDGQDKYIVLDVEQAKKINTLLVEENLEALKDYSTFVLLNDMAQYGDPAYASLHEKMENMLYGITEAWGDEKNWMTLTQDLLPWDFGMIYVEDHFSPEDKEEVEGIIDQILEEYEAIIMRQDWMSQETKKKAIRKLETMVVKIGYPDQWPEAKDMMQVIPVSEGGSLMSNFVNSLEVSVEYERDKLGQEVDRSEWEDVPQTVNAYYDPANNEIVFPAAILQAPFYDRENSDGANLGGIGYIIAHEVSHAFDSTGALYDEYGNYQVWWSDEEMEAYQELSQSIVDYYNNYEVMGNKVNGEMTLMENIADLGAITCITSIIGDDQKGLDEAFSQMAYNWASVDTASFMVYLMNVDTHSPNKVRVNAVLSSCDAFHEIYGVKEGDGMYVAPEDRVGIWR